MIFEGLVLLAGIIDSSSVATPVNELFINCDLSNSSVTLTSLNKMALMVLLFWIVWETLVIVDQVLCILFFF